MRLTPLRYLRNIYSICSKLAIIETHVDALDSDKPTMVFYPRATLGDDSSNYWGPNRAGVEAMLKEVGFSSAELVNHYGTRMVFHARR